MEKSKSSLRQTRASFPFRARDGMESAAGERSVERVKMPRFNACALKTKQNKKREKENDDGVIIGR